MNESREDQIKRRDERLKIEELEFKKRWRKEYETLDKSSPDYEYEEEKLHQQTIDFGHRQSHLIRKFDGMAVKHRDFGDVFLAMAKNIDISLVNAGAIPEVDYTYLDLYRLALPFVLEMFRDKESLSFYTDNF